MANIIPSFEVSFEKATKLLHSPQEDATEKLKAMLDECLAQKKANVMAPKPPVTLAKPPVTIKAPPPAPMPVHIIVPSDDIDCDSTGCVVCKRLEQTSTNSIVECQECHSLYHQQCHKPSLVNENVKDPRFIWYCFTCTNKRKKLKLSTKPASLSTCNASTSKENKEQQNPEVSPFKSWSFLKK